MFDLNSIALPIQAALPELYEHLLESPNCILVAPPGTGKTSLVPLSLLNSPWRQDKKIILLEPRRVATRAAARQMASLYQETLGNLIGYRTRLEKKVSSQTVIEVMTYGLFLRHLLNHPFLEQVSGIIFDEIHERSIESDLCLTLCQNLQENLRPDLRMIAMSATAELTSLQKILKCKVIENKSTIHPITIHHRERDIQFIRDLPQITTRTIHEAHQKEKGNILAFLPGVAEIHRTISLLSIPDAEILPLYGDLPSAEQDKALRPVAESGKRRIVLATSIAETSLTVPGVRIVIDGGFRKTPQLNGDTGLTRLLTTRISRATAEQRAGRAGRETEGTVYRLWTQAMERSLPLHDRPEILTCELSEFSLICQAWVEVTGISLTELVFPDPPLQGMVEAANAILALLGATDPNGQITDFGKKIIRFGSHPRLASMLLRADSDEEKALAADMAALLEERDPFHNREEISCDIQSRLDWLHHPPSSAHEKGLWHRIQQSRHEYRKRLRLTPSQKAAGHPASLLCAAFPDRLAQRRDEAGSFRFSGGGEGHLPRHDPFSNESMLIAGKIHTGKKTAITLAVPLFLKSLPDFILKLTHHTEETTLDPVSGRVIVRKCTKFGNLTVQDQSITATAQQALPVLTQYVMENLFHVLHWDGPARQLQARCSWARRHLKEEKIPDISDESLQLTLQEWLLPWMSNLSSLKAVRELNVREMLELYLGHSLYQRLNLLFPASITLNHHKFMIDYTQPSPMISAKAQKFYGLKETPTIAKGQIPLQCCILSPANRPQAITNDLLNFWTEGWKDMRKDMKGRYPKHDWPENPANSNPDIPSRP